MMPLVKSASEGEAWRFLHGPAGRASGGPHQQRVNASFVRFAIYSILRRTGGDPLQAQIQPPRCVYVVRVCQNGRMQKLTTPAFWLAQA